MKKFNHYLNIVLFINVILYFGIKAMAEFSNIDGLLYVVWGYSLYTIYLAILLKIIYYFEEIIKPFYQKDVKEYFAKKKRIKEREKGRR